ncbi:MAG: 2-oxo acid dehydrogenase subunit E2 [Planctomycetes bacterium]|nr:2-oxo acid dehydrogenase subunit E2 [Planctomycetota bacterium]
MAIPITIPRLGWSMEEGIFLGWLKKDGDPVRAGESIFRLESEKAAEDIECHDAGILRIAPKGPKDGDTLPVGCVIGYIASVGEELQIADFRLPIADKSVAPSGVVPAARLHVATGEPPVATTIASPRARRVATELGIDWTKLHGTGRGGRIRERDVRAAVSLSPGLLVSLSPMRKAGVARLIESARSTVPVTLTTTADVTELANFRKQAKVGVTDVFVKAVALALQQHPLLAARFADDHLVLPEAINIGIAIDTDAGLIVPVVHNAATLSVEQIAIKSRDLIERARTGKLTSKDLQGGVFTITNLGMFGIDAFTPIINYPEAAILGIGRIRRVPVFVGDQVAARDEVTLSLTFDHRVVDGAPAARFLRSLVAAIERPTGGLGDQ